MNSNRYTEYTLDERCTTPRILGMSPVSIVFFFFCLFPFGASLGGISRPLKDPQSKQAELEAATASQGVKTSLTAALLHEVSLQLCVPLLELHVVSIFVHTSQLRKQSVPVHRMLNWIHSQVFFDPKVLHSWHQFLLSASHW